MFSFDLSNLGLNVLFLRIFEAHYAESSISLLSAVNAESFAKVFYEFKRILRSLKSVSEFTSTM